jgi:hypothetical protein
MTRASIDLREELSRRGWITGSSLVMTTFEKRIRSSAGDAINLTGKSPKACPAPREKIFRFCVGANHFPIRRVPPDLRGVSRSSRT